MSLDLDKILKEKLEIVETILSSCLTSSEVEHHVNAMCQSIINAGGKRIRPKLALLAAQALNSYDDKEHQELACNIASIVEMLHTATLIHDDVIDKAVTRRGNDTLNEIEGNHVAVLAGDYMFSKCFSLSTNIENFDLLRFLNNTITALVAGEIDQLKHVGFLDLTQKDYYSIIYCKTGALFELSTASFAIATKQEESIIASLKDYGRNLGIAFQIVDDMLDYSSDTKTLGKRAGEDLEDGRITLPIILALEKSDEEGKQAIAKAIHAADFEAVKSHIQRCGALEASYALAKKAADDAISCLDCLQDTVYKQGLLYLVDKCLNRSF